MLVNLFVTAGIFNLIVFMTNIAGYELTQGAKNVIAQSLFRPLFGALNE